MTTAGAVQSDTALIRTMDLSGTILQPRGTAPTPVGIGTTPDVPALLFDAIAEVVAGSFDLPIDWDPNTNPVIVIKWSIVSARSNAEVASWSCDYTRSREGVTGAGPGKASTTILSTTTVTTGAGLAVGDPYRNEFTIIRGDATNPIVAGDAVHPELHLTNLTGVPSCHVTDAFLRYEALY